MDEDNGENFRMVAVILIDYFSGEKTISFIKKMISKLDESEVCFVIVDNSLNDANAGYMIKEIGVSEKMDNRGHNYFSGALDGFPVDLLRAERNLGYGPGANLGIKYAIHNYEADYLIVSNNDLSFIGDTIHLGDMIGQFSLNDRIGLIGPYIVGLDGRKQTPCKKVNIKDRWMIPCLVYPFNSFFPEDKSDDLMETGDEATEVYRIMGSFMCFKRNVLEKIHYFDEKTFLYAEECIIAEKLLEAGYTTLYYPGLKLLHEHNQTIGNFYDEMAKLKIRFESEIYYYNQYCGVPDFIAKLARFIFSTYILKRKFVKMIKGK